MCAVRIRQNCRLTAKKQIEGCSRSTSAWPNRAHGAAVWMKAATTSNIHISQSEAEGSFFLQFVLKQDYTNTYGWFIVVLMDTNTTEQKKCIRLH